MMFLLVVATFALLAGLLVLMFIFITELSLPSRKVAALSVDFRTFADT